MRSIPYHRAFVVVILLGGLVSLGLGLWAWAINQRGQALISELAALETAARSLDVRRVPEACRQLDAVVAEADGLRALLGPALPLVRGLGGLSSDLAAAGPLLAAADDLGAAGTGLCSSLQILLSPPAADQTVLGAAVARLDAAAPTLAAAQAQLAQAEANLSMIEPDTLSPELAERIARLHALLPSLQEGLTLGLALPELLGMHGSRSYMVVAQNPDELRATGGFISAAGLLQLEAGNVTSLSFADSGRLDDLAGRPYPLAPDPMRRYMVAEPMALALWTFRDANWSPDLPNAIAVMRDLYPEQQGREADGVIVFTPLAVRLLLEATGPVVVQGQSEVIGANNLEAYIRAVWSEAQAEGRSAERKASLERLGLGLIERLNGGELDLAGIARALGVALERGELALQLEGAPGELLAQRGWDGALRPGDSDFLHISSANIGYNKVGPQISQLISYAVDLSDLANPQASVRVTQRNRATAQATCIPLGPEKARGSGYEALMEDCYWSYLRVYVPGAASLIGSEVPVVPDDWMLNGDGDGGRLYSGPGEAGTRVYSALSVVPSAGEASLSFRYLLPPEVLSREGDLLRYRLRLQRQPGAEQRVELRYLLPLGSTLLAASHQPQSLGGQIYLFELDLSHHVNFELLLRP